MPSPLPIKPEILKAAVYGANDGIITTFAVVAGVAGAKLSAQIIIILGISNMIADGFSMGVGDFLGERSQRELERSRSGAENEEPAWHTGVMTFVSFVIAGSFPLLPYFLGMVVSNGEADWMFVSSIIFTGVALFSVGVARAIVTKTPWWRGGLEVLSVGALAAIVAYALGAGIESMIASE